MTLFLYNIFLSNSYCHPNIHGERIWHLGKIGFAYLAPFIKKISVIPDKRPKGVKVRNPIWLCPELATFIFLQILDITKWASRLSRLSDAYLE